MVIPLPSPTTTHGEFLRATRRAGPVFCAMLRYSMLIWPTKPRISRLVSRKKQAPARRRMKREQTLAVRSVPRQRQGDTLATADAQRGEPLARIAALHFM